MRTCTFTVGGEAVDIVPERVVNAGSTDHGTASASSTEAPPTYPLAPYTLLVDPGRVVVTGEHTSGEAAFGLFVTDRETYVVAASDHTDRDLESVSVRKSKQIAPNVLSERAWRYSVVRDHWDRLELRAWTTTGTGERKLYQEEGLDALLAPEELLETVEKRHGGPMNGTAILSGTVPTTEGVVPGTRFVVELHDPVRDRTLRVGYNVEVV
ncbi:DUF2848 family protein [Halospeciosus flavus]|uniref:DUF2848 family protein n=1 Tax=Halospeciosus flavus TaxID=3032283 RepID=A0ABD5Z6F7_9EURY|nr:DUF2848 family protein [Halospeciosus flavus]